MKLANTNIRRRTIGSTIAGCLLLVCLHGAGLSYSDRLGPAALQGLQSGVLALLVCCMLLGGLIYLYGLRSEGLFWYLAAVGCGTAGVLLEGGSLQPAWQFMDDGRLFKVVLLLDAGIAFSLLQMSIRQGCPERKPVPAKWYEAACVPVFLVLMLLPAGMAKAASGFFALGSVLAASVLLVQAVLTGKARDDSFLLLLAAAGMASHTFWQTAGQLAGWQVGYYPWDWALACGGLAAYWLTNHFNHTALAVEQMLKLQKAARQKDEFLALTSHELHHPLRSLIRTAQSVLDEERDRLGETSIRQLELVVAAGERVSMQLHDLLELTQLQENSIRLQLSEIRLSSVAAGVLHMLRFMAEGKPVRLESRIPDDFPVFAADEKRLIQILLNLVHNSLKYTFKGTVALQASAEEGIVRLQVEDTGIGMDPETLQTILMPYEQAYAAVRANDGGIGLGLSISRHLAELHGGGLYVESALGKGTVVTVTIPAAGQAVRDDEHAAAAYTPRHPCIPPVQTAKGDLGMGMGGDRPRILLVDDDRVSLNVLQDMLPPDQYEVTAAAGGNDALCLLDSGPWDLVISDVMMPRLSGYELCRLIRQRFSLSELPVLLLTARSGPADVYAGFSSGANDYVAKPVNALELKSRVQALTDLKRSVGDRLRMEGAYLQAQIQPHFLFNAMNSISALSDIDVERMRRMIDAFSSYLRISFDYINAQRLVPLSYELELVRAYLYIEKERFEDRLDIRWEADVDLSLELPPFSIQPLVENAVKHGIMSRSAGGMIRIRIAGEGSMAHISIADNGAGIDERVLERLLEQRPGRTGIGLLNTDRRLKSLYGQGLTIRSRKGEGTTVSFAVPL